MLLYRVNIVECKSLEDFFDSLLYELNQYDDIDLDFNDFRNLVGNKKVHQITAEIFDSYEKMTIEYLDQETGEILAIVQQ